MIYMGGAGHHGVYEGENLASRARPADAPGHANGAVDELLETQATHERRHEQQPGVSDQVRIVECYLDAVNSARDCGH